MKQVLRKVRLLLENTNADNLGLMKASIKFQLAKLDQVANLHESYREGAITADEAMRCAYKNGPIHAPNASQRNRKRPRRFHFDGWL